MGQKANDGMDARAVLGAAFARGCAPEGAAPIGFHAAAGMTKIRRRRNAHVEAVLKAVKQSFPEAFGRTF